MSYLGYQEATGGKNLSFYIKYTDGSSDYQGDILATGLIAKPVSFTTNPTKIVSYINVLYGQNGSYYIRDLMINWGAPVDYKPYFKKTYTMPEALLAREGYGQSNPEDSSFYNSVDFDNETERLEGYVGEDNKWVGVSDETVNDISHILHDFKGGNDYFFIEVEGSGTVRFENEQKMPVPSSINFAEV